MSYHGNPLADMLVDISVFCTWGNFHDKLFSWIGCKRIIHVYFTNVFLHSNTFQQGYWNWWIKFHELCKFCDNWKLSFCECVVLYITELALAWTYYTHVYICICLIVMHCGTEYSIWWASNTDLYWLLLWRLCLLWWFQNVLLSWLLVIPNYWLLLQFYWR